MTARFRLFVLALIVPVALHAWDYRGHRIVNQLALVALPADFPAFVKTPANAERIAFLAGEPDRWRNLSFDQPLYHGAAMDHYFDVEQMPLAGLDNARLPSLRYDFAVQFAAGRAAHADQFPPIDAARDSGHTREWCGFLPWTIAENYEKVRAAFSYLKTFEELGTPEEVAQAQANVVYYMGFLGHFVGDAAQPLHSTQHANGWVGANPHGYTTWPGFHSWIDSGFIDKADIKFADVAPRAKPASALAVLAREDGRAPVFVAVMNFIVEQNKLVEPLYQMEQQGLWSHKKEEAPSAEGRALIEQQLLAGGNELAAIWMTAWKNTVPDTFLRASLIKRAAAEAAAKDPGDPAPAKTKKAKKAP